MFTRIEAETVQQALDYFCRILELDTEQIIIEALSARDQCFGMAEYDEETDCVTIEIKRTLGLRNFIGTLAHELVHAKQYLDGRLRYDDYIELFVFDDRIIDCEYGEEPFEIEAYSVEPILTAAYFDRFE